MSYGKVFLDLRAFVERHPREQRFALLGKLVRNAHSMVSIRCDLYRALTTLDLLVEQQERLVSDRAQGKQPSEADGLLSSSLFVTALFLYARAVHSQGRDRSTLDIRASLPVELRPDHDRILALRNKHFAHYESADLWENYHVVLVLGDGDMGLSYPNVRRYLRANDARALYRLLERAQSVTEAAYLKASQRLKVEVERLFDADEGVADLMGSYLFAPEDFFSPDELINYLEALEREGWTFSDSVRAKVDADGALF